jgi:hypothetical protein
VSLLTVSFLGLTPPYLIEYAGFPLAQTSGQLTLVSVGLEAGKPLRRRVKAESENAERTSGVLVIISYAIDYKDGERGRNRTFNLLIKSQLLCQLSYAPLFGMAWNRSREFARDIL